MVASGQAERNWASSGRADREPLLAVGRARGFGQSHLHAEGVCAPPGAVEAVGPDGRASPVWGTDRERAPVGGGRHDIAGRRRDLKAKVFSGKHVV